MPTTSDAVPRRATSPAASLGLAMWRASPPLVAGGALMLVVAMLSVVGLLVDPRTIAGAPAWLKPFKFAVSTAIFGLTLAWVFLWIPQWPRVRRVAGWTTAIVFVVEVAIIDAQAWRGTTSHFNVSTPLDAALFGVMGIAILLQTVAGVAVAVALWRQRFADRALGWALRLGMTLTLAGAMTGPLMTRPTPSQLAALRTGARPTIVGTHTVGGPDGGAGIPITGWSREHGDVRVPHFVGLHAIQLLAMLALLLRGWRSGEGTRANDARVRVVLVASASYAALFMLLLVDALRGRSITMPDATTVAALATWATLTLLTLGAIGIASRSASRGRGEGATA